MIIIFSEGTKRRKYYKSDVNFKKNFKWIWKYQNKFKEKKKMGLRHKKSASTELSNL